MSIQIRVVGLVASAIIASAAVAHTAVEWKVSEGGNGHWYEIRSKAGDWYACRSEAQRLGGDLACLDTQAENAFAEPLIPAERFPVWNRVFLGGRQVPGSSPTQGWQWVDGSLWTFTDWYWNQPNGGEGFLTAMKDEYGCTWGDYPADSGDIVFYLAEWSADCNGDGIVDYGQIKSGQLADDNTNGIPDICETSITGVLPPSVPAQGGSTITINGRNFPAQPSVLVDGVAATNIVRVSDSRLTAVTPPLLPGMAPLTVNGFTLPDAIYIRPECGSDLDQNGVVDTADISIILLDFGPCYEPPAALAAPAPTPLLADEPAQKPVQR